MRWQLTMRRFDEACLTSDAMPSGARNRSKQTSSGTPSGMSNLPGKRRFQSKTVQFLYDRYVGHSSKLIEEYQEEAINAEMARKIFRLREKAGLSQRELAKLVGTSASAICRLEDADYDGHSLSMLKRIAEALDRRVVIRFVPVKRLKTA